MAEWSCSGLQSRLRRFDSDPGLHLGAPLAWASDAMWKSVVAVCIGASLGALLRWALGAQFNSLWPELPPGTLIANLLGGYIIGLAIGFLLGAPNLSPEWRLLIITGFCGGLTTFSTFSGEVVLLLQQGRWGWAAATTGAHVVGSVLMTFAGIGTIMWARSA